MKKILVEYGRLEKEQLSFLDNFFLSSFANKRTDSDMELENDEDDEDDGDDDDDSDDRFVSTEKEAGVINWTDESVKDEECIVETSDNATRKTHRWLQSSLIAAAGKGDIIVLALGEKIAVLENNSSADGTYEVIGQFSVADNSQNSSSVYIRSMCVIPLAVTRTTETKDYDFVAIAVGLSNGYVHFYTERGVLLRSELFSEKPIDGVRFGRSVLPGEQEFVVLAAGRMTIVDGLSLHVALKTAKIQIARGEDDVQKIATKALLNVEKIKLAQKISVTDFAVLGPYEQPYVETYAAASVSPAGPKTRVTSLAPPIYTTYMFTGQSPYVAFGWNRFGEAPSNLISEIVYSYGAEIMSNVVSSLPKFGLGSFFGKKGEASIPTQRNRTTENRALASRISTRLEMRSVFEDDGREGERLFPAPYGSPFVAVTDSIARVVLFDTNMRQIRRVWKGYRDARCAWIECTAAVSVKRKERRIEPFSTTAKKKTLLLVLFAPRRGLLEVWLPLNGKRIAAVNVERKGRLISSLKARDCTLGNLALVEDSMASAFFLSSDGKLYKIEVPFYLALLHESTATIHDENVLKEIRQLNSNSVFDKLQLEHFISLMCTLKTASALREALDITVKNRNITVSQYLEIFNALSKYVGSEMCRRSATDSLSLRKHVDVVMHLLNIYWRLQSYHRLSDGTWLTTSPKDVINSSVLISEMINNEALKSKLHLDDRLLEACLKQLVACEGIVKEMKLPDFPFSDFLESFDFSVATSLRRSSTDPQDTAINNEITVKKLSPLLGFVIFAPALKGICQLDDFKNNILQAIGLPQLELLDIFCSFWLTECGRITVFPLSQLLLLCEQLIIQTDNPSNWFKLMENRLYSCGNVAPTFSLCLVARAIAFNSEHFKEMELKEAEGKGIRVLNVSIESEWEKVEYSLERWDFLIKNLLCMSTLNLLPLAPKISLQEFSNSGKAFYREKIGSWVSVYKPDVSTFNEVITCGQSAAVVKDTKNECWVGPLLEFLQFFPLSMKPEFIFCDCAWECVNAWKRDVDKNVDGLKYAMEFMYLLNNSQRLQQAISFLLWETHLKEPLKGLFEWLNKAGKMPKERQARKHVGIGENQLSDFVMHCVGVLQILKMAPDSLDFMISDVQYEDFIEAFFDFQKGGRKATRETLISVLSRQNLPVYDLVLHHYDLACVLELQLALSMRLHPVELFDDELAMKALFVPLIRQQIVPIHDVVASLRRRRQDFVEKCTTLTTEAQGSGADLYELIDSLVHDWALDIDGVTLKQMEGLLVLSDQEGTLRCMYRVRFPELVVERCYPYLLARLRFYIKEYCPDLIGIAKRQGQWPKWTQTALQTSCGANINIARAPTFKEMSDFVSVLQDLSNRISSSTDELLLKIRVLNEVAKVLKFVPNQ